MSNLRTFHEINKINSCINHTFLLKFKCKRRLRPRYWWRKLFYSAIVQQNEVEISFGSIEESVMSRCSNIDLCDLMRSIVWRGFYCQICWISRHTKLDLNNNQNVVFVRVNARSNICVSFLVFFKGKHSLCSSLSAEFLRH